MQGDRLGLLVGGVDEELGLLPPLPLWGAGRGGAQDAVHLFGQRQDLTGQTRPEWRKETWGPGSDRSHVDI